MTNIIQSVTRIHEPKNFPGDLASVEIVEPPAITELLEVSTNTSNLPIPTPEGENEYIEGLAFEFDRDGDLTYFIIENSTVDGPFDLFKDGDHLLAQFLIHDAGFNPSLVSNFTYFADRISLTQDIQQSVDLTVLDATHGSPGYTMYYVGRNSYGESVLQEEKLQFTYWIDGVTT